MWEFNYTNPDVRDDELMHYGIPGMKWGTRKARSVYSNLSNRLSNRRQARQAYKQTDEYKQKVARRNKALKVGAAVAGTAAAAYGGYRLAKHMQNKRHASALNKAQSHLDKNLYRMRSHSVYANGRHEMDFINGRGDIASFGSNKGRSKVGKAIGSLNAKTHAEARQIYRDSTNTRLDRGLARVVKAGDAVGNARRKATSTVASGAKKATNRVLDKVNPIYEYAPTGNTKTTTRKTPLGGTMTTTYAEYAKVKKKRG